MLDGSRWREWARTPPPDTGVIVRGMWAHQNQRTREVKFLNNAGTVGWVELVGSAWLTLRELPTHWYERQSKVGEACSTCGARMKDTYLYRCEDCGAIDPVTVPWVDLKPCPWCEENVELCISPSTYHKASPNSLRWYRPQCVNAKCPVQPRSYQRYGWVKDAVSDWNTMLGVLVLPGGRDGIAL